MRKLGHGGDSLELLLDTVCSMFGAILLIAILVALMAQTSKTETASEQAGGELLQRRVATAEADLAEVRGLAAKYAATGDSPAAALAAEKTRLEGSLAIARSQRDQEKNALYDEITRQTADHSSEWKKMAAELKTLERRLQETANARKAQDQNRAQIEARTVQTTELMNRDKAARVITLRFPKERAQTKRPMHVICQYGKMFPVYTFDNKENDMLTWKSDGSDRASKPIEEKGWTPASEAAARFFRELAASDMYVAFYVFPDSFDAFHALREKAIAAHIDFGISFEPPGATLQWGKSGSVPPPL